MTTDGEESDSGVRRPPKIYDQVEAPEGHVCQRFVFDETGHPVPCLSDAEVLVVYEGSLRPDDDIRRNVLTCRECSPVTLRGESDGE